MNVIDELVNWLNPVAGLKRQQARLVSEQVRAYEAASKGRRNQGWLRPGTSGAAEASRAASILAATGQDLTRNNPLALRIKRVLTNNAIGSGITLEVASSHKRRAKKFNQDFNRWAESTHCDFEQHNTFYGLQNLWLGTVIETGGVLIRKIVDRSREFPLVLQSFEQTQLDTGKNGFTQNGVIVDGIQYNQQGYREGYWLFTDSETGTKQGRSQFFKADSIIHIFRKERFGQHIGVSWFAAIATTLNNYAVYQDAKLMQQQIAACLALLIEGAETPTGISSSATLPDKLEPGIIEYIGAGQKVHTVSPPKADSSNAFEISIKRDIAAPLVTYEQLTGDYSQVNFASGRMGKVEFYNEIDFIQKLLLQPALDKVFAWFGDLHQILHGVANYDADWTYPARAAVDPQAEFDVLMSKVRNGMMSPRKAAKTLGEKLDRILEQWKEDKALMGDLSFDVDPSKFASTGNQIIPNSASQASEQKTGKQEPAQD